MIAIVYETDCHCGGTATSTTLALDQPDVHGQVHIDVDMSIGQTDLTCHDCGCSYATGDIEWLNDAEDSCPGSDDEDDEDDDQADDDPAAEVGGAR